MGGACTFQHSNIIYSSKSTELLQKNEEGSYINYRISRDFDEIEIVSEKENFVHHLIESFSEFKNQNCLGYRKFNKEINSFNNYYSFIKYSELGEMSRNFAYNLKRLNLVQEEKFTDEEQAFKLLGILAENSVEWVSTDIAAQLDSVTLVPLDFNTITERNFFQILQKTKISTLAISKESGFNLLTSFMKNSKNYGEIALKNVIFFNYTTEKSTVLDTIIKDLGLSLFFFTDLIKLDEKNSEFQLNESTRDTIFTIKFSEENGELVGVKLSQKNLSSQLPFVGDSGIDLNSNDSHYSYVPMSNITERVLNFMLITYGACIGFASIGKFSLENYISDVKFLKPTFLFGSPQTLLEIRAYFLHKAENTKGCTKNMIKKAIISKRENFLKNSVIEDSFIDSWALDVIKEEFGGRVRFIMSFFDNLNKDLALDLKILFACPLVEVYGMTELGGICLSTHISDLLNDCIGGPITTSKVKMLDKSNIGFTINNHPRQGELLVKGPSVFPGYFQNKKLTKNKVKDGWFGTGDLVLFQEENIGFRYLDRIENIIVVEDKMKRVFISPYKIENFYSKVSYVSQICVISVPEEDKKVLMAIIVPCKTRILDFLLLNKFVSIEEADKIGIVEKYYKSEKVLEDIEKEFEILFNLDKSLFIKEKVENFCLSKDTFTKENGMIDINGRLNRQKVKEYYLSELK